MAPSMPAAFAASAPLQLPACASAARTQWRRTMVMARPVSRRQLGRFAAAAAVSLAVSGGVLSGNVARAASKPPKPTFINDDSGISYYDIKPGSGAGPIDGDFVIIDYLAFLSNGKIFDNRKGFVFQIGRRQVIPGLESAVSTMKPGGERNVVVPPALAYGDRGVCLENSNECLVPPGETLGYSVTLQRVAVPPT